MIVLINDLLNLTFLLSSTFNMTTIQEKIENYFGSLSSWETLQPNFDALLADSIQINTGKVVVGKAEFERIAREMLKSGPATTSNLQILKIEDNSVEYKVDVLSHGSTTHVHSRALIKDGKFIRLELVDDGKRQIQ